MKNALIINADDFGLSSGVNTAIVACYQAGSLSSTTLMANMPAAKDAITLAKEYPGLGVGLHFNLSSGKPLCPTEKVSSLVASNGEFQRRGVAEKKAIFGKFRSNEILAELEAQWGFLVNNDLAPTHIDSHQHIHVFPVVFDVVARFCVENNIPLRIPKPWRPNSGVPFKRHARMWMLNWMIKRNMNRWNGKLAVNESFASIFDLQIKSQEISLRSYKEILQAIHNSPLELMIHPADVDFEHAKLTGISQVSRRDFEIFSKENFGDVARDLGYDLVSYLNLKR